jgi:hypothetical protein
MSEAFEKHKALLAEQGKLHDEDMEKTIAEHGAQTDEERIWLES